MKIRILGTPVSGRFGVYPANAVIETADDEAQALLDCALAEATDGKPSLVFVSQVVEEVVPVINEGFVEKPVEETGVESLLEKSKEIAKNFFSSVKDKAEEVKEKEVEINGIKYQKGDQVLVPDKQVKKLVDQGDVYVVSPSETAQINNRVVEQRSHGISRNN